MTSQAKGGTTKNVYVNILAKTKTESEACVDALFPGRAGKLRGTRVYHVFTGAETGREAVENEEPRMETLKGGLSSRGSSMEADSLPGYDDLYQDGGGDGLRPQSGCCNTGADADGDQRMSTLKSARQQGLAEDSWSSSVPSTSTSSYDHTWSTGSYEVIKQYHVYEIPWSNGDPGLLWCTMPINQSVFFLVIDMDNIHPEITDDYVDMLQCIDDLCNNKSVFEDTEKPTLFLVGRSQKSGKDPFNNFTRSLTSMRDEFSRHAPRCRFDSGNFLLIEGATEPLQRLRQSLDVLPITAMGQNIPLVSEICQTISSCDICTVSMAELMRRIGCRDRSNFVNTLKYLQSVGSIVYVESADSVFTKPELLTEACADLQNLPYDQLTKYKVMTRLTDNLKLSKADASACITALESLGILTEITEPNGTNNHTHSHDNKTLDVQKSASHYLCSLNLTPGKDFFQTMYSSITHTPVLRFSLGERQPLYVFCNMLLRLLQKRWHPAQQGGSLLLNQQSVALRFPDKNNAGSAQAYLTTDRKCVYLTVVSFKQGGAELDRPRCADLREDVESAITSATQSLEPSSRIRLYIRCMHTEGALTGDDGWHEVGSLQTMYANGDTGFCFEHKDSNGPHEIKPSQLLTPWFPNKERCASSKNGLTAQSSTMEFEPSAVPKVERPLKDGLLSKVSKCFGQGWDMFFVENDVDQADVDKAKENNPRQMTKQVYDCLRCWKEDLVKRGITPTVKLLRTRMKKCDHLTVNWDKFEEIVNED